MDDNNSTAELVESEYYRNIHETTDTILFGDIIKLSYSDKKRNSDHVYKVIYIDEHTIELTNIQEVKKEEEKTITFEIYNGFFWEKKKEVDIECILLLQRNPLHGFVKQNNLYEGQQVILSFNCLNNIVFVTGNIVKVDEDSITINTLTEGTLFIDFAYKGFLKTKNNTFLSIDIVSELPLQPDTFIEGKKSISISKKEEEELLNFERKVEENLLKDKHYCFPRAEQEIDVFLDFFINNDIQYALNGLKRFRELTMLTTSSHETFLPSNYLMVINDSESNYKEGYFKILKDTDYVSAETFPDIKRILKDDYVAIDGVLEIPRKKKYDDVSILDSQTASILAKANYHLNYLSVLNIKVNKNLESKIISNKNFIFQNEYRQCSKFVHYTMKYPITTMDGFEMFLRYISPSFQTQITTEHYVGPVTIHSLINNYVQTNMHVNINHLKAMVNIIKSALAKIYYDHVFEIKKKHKLRYSVLPLKTLIKNTKDKLKSIKDSIHIKNVPTNIRFSNKNAKKSQEASKSLDLKRYFYHNTTSHVLHFSEVLSQMNKIDFGQTYTQFVSLENIFKPSIKNYIKHVIQLVKDTQKTKKIKEDENICDNVIILAKTYHSKEDVLRDNKREIFFDSDESKGNENDDEEIFREKKSVNDGHFAILNESNETNETNSMVYLKRVNSTWQVYNQTLDIKDIILSNIHSFCELQPDCIRVREECQSIANAKKDMNTILLKQIENHLESEYMTITSQTLDSFTYFDNLLNRRIQLQNQNQNQNQDHTIQISQPSAVVTSSTLTYFNSETRKYSHEEILDIVFKNTYERNGWFVCSKTNGLVIPKFIVRLIENNSFKLNAYKTQHFISNKEWIIDTVSGFSFPEMQYPYQTSNSNEYHNENDQYGNYNAALYFTTDSSRSADWLQIASNAFLNCHSNDLEFIKTFYDETSVNIGIGEKLVCIFSCIYILSQTRFDNILIVKNKFVKPASTYKGFPFYSNDVKDNEGLQIFSNLVYEWIEDKKEFYPFTEFKKVFSLTTNKKLFIETFCKALTEWIEQTLIHDTVYQTRIKTFWKSLQKKTITLKKQFYNVTNWNLFQPVVSPLLSYQCDVNFQKQKQYIETTLIDSYLVSLDYQKKIIHPAVKPNPIDETYFQGMFQSSDNLFHNWRFNKVSYLFYQTELPLEMVGDDTPVFKYANIYSEQTIYRCFLRYCKFNVDCPLYVHLAKICDGFVKDRTNQSKKKKLEITQTTITTTTTINNTEEDNDVESLESYNKRRGLGFKDSDSIDLKIEKLKENGQKYTCENLNELLIYLHNKSKIFMTIESSESRFETIRKTTTLALQYYPENIVFIQLLKLLDRFEIEINKDIKLKDTDYITLLDTISKTNDKYNDNITDYVYKKLTDKSKEEEEKDDEGKKEEKENNKKTNYKCFKNEIVKCFFSLKSDDCIDTRIVQFRYSMKYIIDIIPSSIIHNKPRCKIFNKYKDNKTFATSLNELKTKGNLFLVLAENTSYCTENSCFDKDVILKLFAFYFLSFINLFLERDFKPTFCKEVIDIFFQEAMFVDTINNKDDDLKDDKDKDDKDKDDKVKDDKDKDDKDKDKDENPKEDIINFVKITSQHVSREEKELMDEMKLFLPNDSISISFHY